MKFTSSIRARDFEQSTVVDRRDEWTGGKMRALIAALNGAPVVITTDNRTGHAEIGARLVGCEERYSSGYVTDRVIVERDLGDGTTQRIAYRLTDIGDTIIPLEDGRARWDALENYQAIVSAARKAVAATGRTPECSGTWDVTVFCSFANAHFRPHGERTFDNTPTVKVERRTFAADEAAGLAEVAARRADIAARAAAAIAAGA